MDGSKNISARGYLQQGRASGYTEESAHKEHSDNSEDAGAQNVSFFFTGEMASRKCYTLDDGAGMTSSGLDASLIWAGTRSDRDSADIGKFGLGMKTAALNLGNKCIVLTKTSDGVVSGAYLDFEDMERNDYLNHKTIVNPLEDNLVAAYVSPFIIERFKNQVSGTLIVTWELLRNNIKKTADACNMLLKDLAVSYLNKRITIHVIHLNGHNIITNHTVPQVDPFYRDNNDALQKPRIETELYVFANDDDNSYKIIEKSTSSRSMGGNKSTSGTVDAPKYYMFCPEKKSHKWVETSARKLPTTSYSIISLSVIFIKEADYNNEQFIKDTRIADRNGFYFRRGKRYVAYGQRLGVSMNMELNRMRCEVSFNPDLDKELGLTFNKNMGAPCDAIKNSLVSIWGDVTRPWVKEVQEQRRANTPPEETTVPTTLPNLFRTYAAGAEAGAGAGAGAEAEAAEAAGAGCQEDEAVPQEVAAVPQEDVAAASQEDQEDGAAASQEDQEDGAAASQEDQENKTAVPPQEAAAAQDDIIPPVGVIPEGREVRHRTGPVSQDIKVGLEFINIADGRLRVNKNGVKLREFSVHGKGSAWLEIFRPLNISNRHIFKKLNPENGLNKVLI